MRGPPTQRLIDSDDSARPAGRGGSVPCVAGHGTVLDELRVDGIRVVCVDHAPGLAIHRHAHDRDKLVILMTGGATERIGQEVIEHRLLDVVAREKFRAHENQYHASGARSILVELDGPVPTGQLAPSAARQHGLRLVAAFCAPRSARPRRMRRAVAEVVAALREARPAMAPSWLAHARELLFAQQVQPPRLVELAAQVGIHPVHLAQAFRRHWNMTPLGYVRAHRVFRAVELIARGGALAEVAAAVGFADQSHMTRAIRRARAASPGALQRTMRAPPAP